MGVPRFLIIAKRSAIDLSIWDLGLEEQPGYPRPTLAPLLSSKGAPYLQPPKRLCDRVDGEDQAGYL